MHSSLAKLSLLLSLCPGACLPHDADIGPEHSSKRQGTKTETGAKTQATKKDPTSTKKTSSADSAKRRRLRRAAESDPALGEGFQDNFERSALGDNWRPTGPHWRIEGGRLCGKNAHNHPIWLKRQLPTNARVEFEAVSNSPDGDIKVELWGDGSSYASGTSYNDATSYLAIFGGWQNRFHVLARLKEHAPDRHEIRLSKESANPREQPVEAKRSYHMRIERQNGALVRWLVDDLEVLGYNDDKPLSGKGHEHFGFNDWQVPVCFDNLKITPL